MWPFTRLTDYIANSVPRIKAADLNSFQDYIIGLFAGSKSIKKLLVDGVGDQSAASVPNGDIVATGSITTGAALSGTTAPTTTVPRGKIAKGNVAFGWVRYNGVAGSLSRGFNLKSVAKTGTGQYDVTFNGALVDGFGTAVFVTPRNIDRFFSGSTTNFGGDLLLQLVFHDSTGALVDTEFSAGVFGE